MDYHQTLLSLLDVLSEVYNKIYKLLGPSPFAHPSQHMMGPLGLLSPHPGVSYLFSTDNSPPNANANHLGPTIMSQYSHSNTSLPHPHHANASGEEMSSSLWSIANPGAGSVSSAMYGGALGSPPPVWTPALGEMVLKIDGKFKVCVLYFFRGGDLPLFLFMIYRKSPHCCSRNLIHLRGMASRTNWHHLIPC